MEQTTKQKPDSYLLWAILSTLFCCLPLGIVSIVYATKVDSLWAQGQYDEAILKSQQAKKFAIISAVAGLVVSIIYGLSMTAFGLNS